MRALVLSGGGLFGAWQAGAWSALAEQFQPDLIVGASVGSLNGYAIACGATPEMLREMWLDPKMGRIGNLHANLRETVGRYPLRTSYALTVTDLLRMKPRIFRDNEITWQHLAASCALPGVLPQVRIDGRFYSDGGLLNPLPIWAAVDLGATKILALHALPVITLRWMKPFILGFQHLAGYHPPVPHHVKLLTIAPPGRLGRVRDAIRWERSNIERWLKQGATDAAAAVTRKTFSF